MSLLGKQRAAGWTFLAPATIMIAIMSFYPMIRAFIISLQTGAGANMRFADPIFSNYKRILADKVFQQSIANTFLYLIIQVPIMLILAILLAQLLNNKDLKFKGFFRTCVFLPCATSLVSYSLIFRSMFATDGLINSILIKLGILSTGYNFLGNSASAKIVIILALIWRWTGYNMVFYLAGLQNIEYSVYEAAKIDGANGWKTFWKITVPLLKPTIIMTFIMSINGTLQLFDESVNLTKGGPANSTITMSHYIYNTCFINVPNFGYAAAMSFIIFIMVAVLAFINLKVGDHVTKKNKSAIQRRLIPTYIFLIIVSFISVFPLYWMISAATNTSTDVSRGRIIPGSHFMENFRNLTSQQPLWRALGNSFFYAILTTVICLLICSIAGYGFEVYHDKWKDRVFSILLLAMMVPQVATMVPLFKMFSKAGLLNTAVGFILPIISTPFMIMMFRQNARSFPVDIIEAARIDGLNEVRIFFQMFIPTMKSTYAAAAVITFMNAWNSYLWPKVIMTDNKAMTMPMLIANLITGYVTDYGMLMCGVLFCSIPTMIVFFVLQKQFAEGITGAVK